MTDVHGKTVLVTGAGGGLGAQMVAQLCNRNCSIIATDIDGALLENLGETVVDLPGKIALTCRLDLSRSADCRSLAQECRDHGLVPDILINNAGIAVSGRHTNVPIDRWEKLIKINLLAPMRLVALFLEAMIEKGNGHIVNISSLAGWVGAPNLSAYVASKFGLRGFGEALAADEARNRIRVSNVYPSFTRTPILDSEQFGMGKKREIPERMISDPETVVKNILSGIERNTLQIFPDKTARRVHYLQRFVPWAIPLLGSRLQTGK